MNEKRRTFGDFARRRRRSIDEPVTEFYTAVEVYDSRAAALVDELFIATTQRAITTLDAAGPEWETLVDGDAPANKRQAITVKTEAVPQ